MRAWPSLSSTKYVSISDLKPALQKRILELAILQYPQVRSKSCCNCNHILRCLLKILEQTKAWPSHFFGEICQHFGYDTRISDKDPWANHTPISTISFKILLQQQSHITIFVKNPGANKGRSFQFLWQNLSAARITNPHFRKKIDQQTIIQYHQFRLKSCCNCNRISGFSLKLLKQMRAWPSLSSTIYVSITHLKPAFPIKIVEQTILQYPQFRSKACCNCSRISRFLLKILEQIRVGPFNFFDEIC